MEKSKVYKELSKVVENYGKIIDNYFDIDFENLEIIQMNGLSVFNNIFSYEDFVKKLNECKPWNLDEKETKSFHAEYGKKLITLNMLFNLKHDIVEYYNFLQLHNVPIYEYNFSIIISKFTYDFTYQYVISIHYPNMVDFTNYFSINNAMDTISAHDYSEKCFKKESQLIKNIHKGFHLFAKQYIMNIIRFSKNECLDENFEIKDTNICNENYCVIKKLTSDITDSYFIQTTEL